MQFALFNKKEVRVKSFTRKGKVVKGYNRIQDALIKKNSKGKKELTNLSKGLIGVGTLGTLALGYKNRRLVEDVLHKVKKKINSDKLSQDVTLAVGKPFTSGVGQTAVNMYKNAPDLTPEETKKLKEMIEKGIKSQGKLNTTATGDEFFKLRDRRDLRNKNKLEKRKENARGLIGGYKNYSFDDDLYTQININRRNNGNRKKRKELANKLRKQLGGNFRRFNRLRFF
jgi:hypothetical protein